MSHLLDIRQLRWPGSSKQHERSIDYRSFDDLDYSPLCAFCTTRGIWHHLSGKHRFTLADWVFGFITDPQDVNDPERQQCPFCRLVFDVLPETALAEEHKHQYQKKGASTAYCSLRPVKIKVRNEYFTSFVVAYNFLEYTSFSNKAFQNYRAWIGLETPARRMFNTPGISPVRTPDLLDPNLIRRWVNRCHDHHPHCSERRVKFADRSCSTVMIDIRRSCLVEATTSCRYAALSYVWGQVRSLQTTRANVKSLMTPGALQKDVFWHQIPQVIQDCIILVRAVGIPYLWVDSLCIVQDDFAQKHDQIARMDTIYLQSQITIIPYNGKSAAAPIPGVRPGTRANFSTKIPCPAGSGGEDLSMTLTCGPEWPSLQHDSIHETRAWILQEKVLAIRCVMIPRWGMWFQCLTTRYSDVEPGELSFEPEHTADMCLLSLETPRHLSSDDWVGWDDNRMNEFLSFAQHVEWYSARRLTFQNDRIDAFQGILHLFEDQCQQEFLWAHPEGPLLPISLLWIHVDVGRSRDAKRPPGGGIVTFEDYLPDRHDQYPNWS